MPHHDFDPTAEQTRSYALRSAQVDGHTLTGIGVPYDTETEVWSGFFESFARGSVTDDSAILCYGHAEGIGRITEATDTDEGRQITATISETSRGTDVATLLRDGVLSKLSIRFKGGDYEATEREDGTHVRWLSAQALEYSVVELPAYPTATITDVRSAHPTRKDPTMPDSTLTRDDLDATLAPLTQGLDDLTRDVKLIRSHQATREADEGRAFPFRSLGHYLKALATRDADLHETATRAYEGAVIADTIARPGWLGSLETRMTLKQEVTNLFLHTTDLPAEGMTVEYAMHDGDTTVTVAQQENEGADLTKGKPAKYKTVSAAVKTYGGAGELSLQAIERATVSLLDDLLYDQALKYGEQIETATRTVFNTTVTANEATPAANLPALATATVNDWIDALLALLDAYDQTPYVMDGLAVSPTVFAHLAKLDRNPKALQFSGEPTDHQGTLTLATGTASFATLTVKRIPRWEGIHATGYTREAIRIKEAPGAPLRLQDSNVVNLTKAFSVYGYAAHFAPKPGLIKPIKIAAA